jgi:AcrR family transcriptional regulator
MRKGDETREKILMRAARLFNEKGYFGASLADLMEATGLKKGGLYNHFESKEKLALEAFDYAIDVYGLRFEEALKPTPPNACLRLWMSFEEAPPIRPSPVAAHS